VRFAPNNFTERLNEERKSSDDRTASSFQWNGVKFFATEASAYWFLDIVGTEYHPIQTRGEPFIVVEMQVTHNTRNKVANIRVTDGGSRTLAVRRIDYTDCPQGFWKFYLENDVLSLPSEQ
jgi:hypothetical protein